ncbi:hypothetical protein [Methylobacterium aerolatum]|uniref:Uncharacterized protein n=1 Tax=Methylobacterium aerolatum TaxID=418708 RepID=A0ABU0HW16_9HYPH|nr:hypothetical protein [Methylobacterium aerolatum]MDQ0446527.1 hypothetical protein [Methylobacterium aerolatum]
MRALALLALLLCAAPAAAQPLTAGSPCGGDAFSSAQVIEHRPPRRGPLTAVPDTLCADVAPQQPPVDLQIQAYPVIVPQVGRRGHGGPY